MGFESTLLVRPEHLNHHGFLFGGRLLEWLDEQAYIAAVSRLRPEANLVTVAIDRVEFRHQVREGTVLCFRSNLVHLGKTSLTVHTVVEKARERLKIFRAYVTFVSLGPDGRPRPAGPLLLEPLQITSGEQRRHWREVEEARKKRGTIQVPLPRPPDGGTRS